MTKTLSSLNIGDKIVFGKHQIASETPWPITWIVIDKNHSGYPSNSVTLMTEKVIDCLAFDAAKDYSSQNNGTTTDGNNRWSISNIRQWLNSNKAKGKWYSIPTDNPNDYPPDNTAVTYKRGYSDRAGFLYNFSIEEQNLLLYTTLQTQKNTKVYDGTLEETIDRVFLPSSTELTNEKQDDALYEGTVFSNFLNIVGEIGYKAGLVQQIIDNNTSSLTFDSEDLEYYHTWQRGCYVGKATSVTVSDFNAGNGFTLFNNMANANRSDVGIQPFINLSGTVELNDNPDSNGNYTLTINGSNHEHNWSTEWSYNSNYHWNECLNTNCDIIDNSQKNGYGAHQESDWIVIKEATTTETGLEHKVCTICGYEISTREIPMIESGGSFVEGTGLADLPIGSKVIFGKHQVETETPWNISWIIIDKNHKGYPDSSVTLLSEKIIDFRCYDATEPNNTVDTFAKEEGNGYYPYSNIRQWLNSDKTANNWYTAQHQYDTPPSSTYIYDSISKPTAYNDNNGFLYNFSSAEKQVILNTTLSIYNETNENYVDIIDKIFLLSPREMDSSISSISSSYYAEDVPFDYFDKNSAKAIAANEVINNSKLDSDYLPSQNENVGYILRNCNSYRTVISSSGGILNGDLFFTDAEDGLRPALNIKNNVRVSDTPNSNGEYTIYPNEFVDITTWSASWSYNSTHHWHDCLSGDCLDITDNSQKEGYGEHQSSEWQIITEPTETSTGLKRKVCTICGYIIAEETIPVIVPENKGTTMQVEMTSPLKVDRKPSKIMMSNWVNYYEKYITAIYVCNNGFDFSPNWENATDKILNKQAFLFTNTIRLADYWGIKVKITLSKELEQDKLPLNGFAFYWN